MAKCSACPEKLPRSVYCEEGSPKTPQFQETLHIANENTEQRRTGLVWKELWVLEYRCKKSTKNFRPPRNLTLSLSRLFIPLHNCCTKKTPVSVSGAIHCAFKKSLTVSTRARKVAEFSVAYCSFFCLRCITPVNQKSTISSVLEKRSPYRTLLMFWFLLFEWNWFLHEFWITDETCVQDQVVVASFSPTLGQKVAVIDWFVLFLDFKVLLVEKWMGYQTVWNMQSKCDALITN